MSKRPKRPYRGSISGISANSSRAESLAELAKKLEMVTQAYVRSEREKKSA